jgi:hypothetical protein
MSLAPADLAAWDAALDSLEQDEQRESWNDDPVAWTQGRLGEHVWSKQAEIMRSVELNDRTAVPSCNGSGKSHIASRIVARFIDIHEPGTAFVFTTAPRAQQVKAILWRYIRRAHKKAGLPGVITQGQIPEWKIDGDLVGFGRKPADVDADTVMGLHEYKMLIVLDEADGINAGLWDSIESLMTNDVGCHVLAIGNPLDNSSRFARICDGTEPGWNVIRISAFDLPALTGEPVPQDVADRLTSKRWVEDKKIRWGENNPLYIGKVLGLHPDSDEGLIPMSWIRAANDRWHEWNDSPTRDTEQPTGRRVFGVDVGHLGEDQTCIATRQGNVVMSVESWSKLDTVAVTGLVEARLKEHAQFTSVVDAIGVGAGVVDLLRARGRNVQAFVASAGTKRRDATGTQGFRNLRGAAWWNLRELLDPALGATLALPPDDDLTADLATPRWEPVTGAKIVVESKDDIRKRLGRSTDAGDAVAMACWVDPYARATHIDRPKPRARSYANSVRW